MPAKYVRDADAESPAGGVSSSVNDVATWLAMVLRGGTSADGTAVVDPAALRAALTPVMRSADGSPVPQQIDARTSFYGYGFGVATDSTGRVELSHSGAFALGFGTSFLAFPNLDLGIVVLTNAAANGTAETLTHQFADIAKFGSVQFDWLPAYQGALAGGTAPVGSLVGETAPASPAPASPNAAYVGSYANDYYGPLTISEIGRRSGVGRRAEEHAVPAHPLGRADLHDGANRRECAGRQHLQGDLHTDRRHGVGGHRGVLRRGSTGHVPPLGSSATAKNQRQERASNTRTAQVTLLDSTPHWFEEDP